MCILLMLLLMVMLMLLLMFKMLSMFMLLLMLMLFCCPCERCNGVVIINNVVIVQVFVDGVSDDEVSMFLLLCWLL